jgi:hypothetical protein
MPVKQRTAKGRHLDTFRLEQLESGPDACLIAGAGYLAEVGPVATFAGASPEQQAAILELMRGDWHRHRDRLTAEGGVWWAAEAFD